MLLHPEPGGCNTWLNEDTQDLRRACRKAACRWKKYKLQVSYKILQEALVTYQNAVKTAKTNYFMELISRYNGNSKVLFNTINSVLNPSATCSAFPAMVCDDFNFFRKLTILECRLCLVLLTLQLLIAHLLYLINQSCIRDNWSVETCTLLP